MIEINNKKLCESCFCEAEGEPCLNCGFSAAEYSADPLVLPIGTKLNDKIIIGRVMGKGGFGVTYLGYDLRMDKIIAIKEYYPNGIAYRAPGGTEISINDPKSEETFEKGAEKFYAEAEMVSQFNGNPNIVSVYDYFRENNTVYLVMEFIQGITLKNYIKKHGRLSDGQALFVMDKIAAALSITHSAGVLHRDISPDNIMICFDGKIKLIDFGAARQILEESSSNLTVVMKHGYTPIEQYTKKGRQGAWTDIYSLGASVYYALTEVVIDDPYSRMDNDGELAENKHGINNDLWNILKKCTMLNSSDRYGSAIDLRKALKSVSAPMKAEPIILADDDLKEERDKASETAEAPKTAKKEFPAVVAAAEENEDIIEIFESESVTPENNNPYIQETKASENSADSAKNKGKAKSKKTLMIGTAAAVIIIGAVGVFAVIGNRGDDAVTVDNPKVTATSKVDATDVPTVQNTTKAEETEATTEDIPVKPLYIPIDNYLWDWSYGYRDKKMEITKDDLRHFEDSVKITLDIELVYEDEWAAMCIEDGNRKVLDIQAYNMGRGTDDRYVFYKGQTKFAFVITSDVLENANGCVLRGHNIWVKGATVEDYDPKDDEVSSDAEIIQMDYEYTGDWQDQSPPIPKKVLESFNGDVRVTLEIEVIEADQRDNDHRVHILPCGSEGNEDGQVNINADYITPCEYGERLYALYNVAVPNKFTFVITADEISKLSDYGLFFVGSNYIAKSAALEKA